MFFYIFTLGPCTISFYNCVAVGTAVSVINTMFDYLFDLFDWSSPLNRIFRQFIVVGLFCVCIIVIVCA